MFKILENGTMPALGTELSACIDLYASEYVQIGAGETKVVGLGVALTDEGLIEVAHRWLENNFGMPLDEVYDTDIEIDVGIDSFMRSHHFEVHLRSSKGREGLILPNGVGIIDIDYRDEIKIIIHNPMTISMDSYMVNAGDKIAQIKLASNETHLLGFTSDTKRVGGIGSTGQ